VGEPEGLGIYLASVNGGKAKKLTVADSTGLVLPPNRIVFVRQGALVAREFDLATQDWTGDAVTLAEGVGLDLGFAAAFSTSANGQVAYRPGGAAEMQLAWFDRTGQKLSVIGTPDPSLAGFPQLSPDERRVALYRSVAGNGDIWLLDLVRGGMTRLTTEATNDALSVWSPDGSRIVFTSNPRGVYDLFIGPANGAGAIQPLLQTPYVKVAQHWSSDGRYLLYFEVSPKTGRDLWALDMTSTDRKTRVVANTPFDETIAEFSRDARWVAYQTNESGHFEIVVQPFPEATSKLQVSTEGGLAPRWRADGKELYFVAPDGTLMAVPIRSSSGSTLDAGAPVRLFPTRTLPVSGAQLARPQYAIARDGRFLISQPVEGAATSPITVILNWKPKH